MVVGFTRFEAWMTALENNALGRNAGQEGEGVETKMEYFKKTKNTSLQLDDRLFTERTQSSRIKANNSKHSLTHTHTHTPQ